MVAMVPNTPRYFTVEPLPVAAEPLVSPWICAMKVQATKVTRIGFVFVTQEYFNTCSRTLAVSKGKVSRSAMQAAVPAPTNFTAAEGGTSAGLNPTIFHSVFQKHKRCICEREHDKMFLQNLTETNLTKTHCIQRQMFFI